MKLSKGVLAATAFIMTASASTQAFGWADLGHQVIGEVAEQNLSQKGKDFIRGVLGIEALAVASTFPDHSRSDERFGHYNPDPDKMDHFDFSPFHFCEIPVGDTWTTRAKKPMKDCYGAIKNGMDLLASRTATREEKIIALRYLVHVVGDIHQPLHVGNGYDRGANACEVKWANSNGSVYPLKLHEAWDSNIVRFLGEEMGDKSKPNGAGALRYYNQYAKALKQRNPGMYNEAAKQKAAGGLDFVAWLEEAAKFRESIYPDKADDMKDVKKGEEYKNRPYCGWYLNQEKDKATVNKVDRNKVPTLDKAYQDKHVAFVEKQLVTGGLRLASIIDAIALKAATPAPIDDAQQDKIIKSVQEALRNK